MYKFQRLVERSDFVCTIEVEYEADPVEIRTYMSEPDEQPAGGVYELEWSVIDVNSRPGAVFMDALEVHAKLNMDDDFTDQLFAWAEEDYAKHCS
jgi:hypothetical protein